MPGKDTFMEISEIYGTWNLLLYEEENVLNYRPGGYHPVVLGDTLKDGRYKIHHKLGHGGFSTVWVARDSELEQWVSVKIVMADRTYESRELHNLRELAKYSRGSLHYGHIVQLLDDFIHEGPNGCHQCLVFELLGPTVHMIINDCNEVQERLDSETVLQISTQMLESVAFMHEAGYAHGDWVGWPIDEDEDDEDIRVIDLGEAFDMNTVPERLAQPGGMQAPETIFTGRFDYRVDLWRAGLIIYHLTVGASPFHWFRMDMLVASMIDFVGELPPEWLPKWNELKLDGKGDFHATANRQQLSGSRLERRFEERVHEAELKILLPVIRGLTRFSPSDRISASQALDLIKGNECAESSSS
ncbi:MAG: hypothetical protein M1817_000697 [Caeruleum heppii]|nr:MAG: hypothetical protein M1817_000697 [Caeruleum heppii]